MSPYEIELKELKKSHAFKIGLFFVLHICLGISMFWLPATVVKKVMIILYFLVPIGGLTLWYDLYRERNDLRKKYGLLKK